MRLGNGLTGSAVSGQPNADQYVYDLGGFTQDFSIACPAAYDDGGTTPTGARACYPQTVATPPATVAAAAATSPVSSLFTNPLVLLVLVAVVILVSAQPAEGERVQAGQPRGPLVR